MSVLVIVLAVLCAVAASGITIENMPKGVVWCGATHLLNLSYSTTDVPDGTQLRVTLVANTVGSNKFIADLGMVTAPTKEFNVTLPQPFPVSWIGQDKLKNNTGGWRTDVLFEIIRMRTRFLVSSACGSFCVEPEFVPEVLPYFEYCQSAAATNCSCATGDVCNAGFQCGSNRASAVHRFAWRRRALPHGPVRAKLFNCQCPSSTIATCQALREGLCQHSHLPDVNMRRPAWQAELPLLQSRLELCEAGLCLRSRTLCRGLLRHPHRALRPARRPPINKNP
jgi:hypothetical protein